MSAIPPFLLRLGLDGRAGERDIRRAYGHQLKQLDQALQAGQFQALRQDYEQALAWCRAAPSTSVQGAAVISFAPPPANITIRHARAALTVPAPSIAQDADDANHATVDSLWPDFVQSVRLLGTRGSAAGAAEWAKLLGDTLAQPVLQDLQARPRFEHRIVALLADGWRPGHDGLFPAALEQFGWAREHGRLLAMGQAGRQLDQAVLQYQHFVRAAPLDTRVFDAAIARLREALPPSQYEANYALACLPALLARYPQWLAVVTRVDHLQHWQEHGVVFAEPEPVSHAPATPDADTAAPRQLRRREIVGIIVLGLLLLMAGLRLAAQWQNRLYAQVTTAPGPTYIDPDPVLARELDHLIRPRLFYRPPPGLITNPGVRFQLQLSRLGYIEAMQQVGSSGLPEFDLAAGAAIKRSEPFSNAVPRAVMLTLYTR